jgi:hypothetical protein
MSGGRRKDEKQRGKPCSMQALQPATRDMQPICTRSYKSKNASGYPIAWKPKKKKAMASGDSQGNESAAAATNVDGPKVDLLAFQWENLE